MYCAYKQYYLISHLFMYFLFLWKAVKDGQAVFVSEKLLEIDWTGHQVSLFKLCW